MAEDTITETSTPETPAETTEEVESTVEDTTTDGEEGEEGKSEEQEQEAKAEEEAKLRKRSRLDKRFHDLTTKIKTTREDVGTWRAALEEVTGEAPPERDKFATLEDYRDAIEDYRDKIRTPKVMLDRAEKTANAVEAEYTQALSESWVHKIEEAKAELPNYQQVVSSSTIPLHNTVLKLIMESPVGPHLAYHLANNEDVAYDLISLPLEKQLLELGRLESKVQSGRKAVPVIQKKTPTLAAPPATLSKLSTKATPAKVSPANMTLDQYAAWRAKGGGK